MQDLDLAPIEARLAALTGLPWRRFGGGYLAEVRTDGCDLVANTQESGRLPAPNAEFIAQAPADIAALVAEVKNLRARRAAK